MRIQSITAENFRCFKRLEVNLRDSAEFFLAALMALDVHGETGIQFILTIHR